MRRSFIRLGLASAALLVGSAAVAPPSDAVVGALVLVGSGTIAPGLINPCPTGVLFGPPPTLIDPCARVQSVNFSGTAVGAIASVGAVAGTFNCSFAGGSSAAGETTASGQGTMSGSCAGGTVGVGAENCAVSYTRVGVVVLVTLQCTGSLNSVLGPASANGIGAGVFLFVPDQLLPPITSYRLVGAPVLVG
jgi:hypothetical protein